MGNLLDELMDAIELDHLSDEMLESLEIMFANVPYPSYQEMK